MLNRVLTRGGLRVGIIVTRGLATNGDRGYPVIQFAPPLIAGPEQFAEMEAALRPALLAATAVMANS